MRERSVLEHHPELAQLWTLHYAGRVALRSIEYARSFAPPLFLRTAVEELRRSIDEMLAAVERYKAVVERDQGFPDELRVMIPANWTAEQADAVWTLLSRVSDGVWDVHHEQLVALAMAQDERAAAAVNDALRR